MQRALGNAVICTAILAAAAARAQCVEQWLPPPVAVPAVSAAVLDDPDGPGPNPGRIVMIAGGQLHQWDGTALTRLSTELIPTSFGPALAVYNGEIYVAALFTSIGGVPARYIARFDGAAWHDVASSAAGGFNFAAAGFSPTFNLAVFNGELYFGGGFSVATGGPAERIARWDGATWRPLGPGLTGFGVHALHAVGGELYVGGEHWGVPGVANTYALAKWSGSAWSGSNNAFGPHTYVTTIGDYNGVPHLFGALYDPSGTVVIGGVARKTASSWEMVPGGGVSGGPLPWVSAFRTYRGRIAAAGLFIHAGSATNANDIAFHNGASWSRLQGGIGVVNSNHSVSELIVYRDELHVFGNFQQVNGLPQQHWARWYEGPPVFTGQPQSTYLTACDRVKIFSTSATGASSYRWRLDGVDLADGPTGHGGAYSGSGTSTLTITAPSQQDAGRYDCVATNACGSRDSDDALLIACAVDFNCDGFVDFFDYDDYVRCYEIGVCSPAPSADFNGDGFVDFFDYDDFVAAFETGC